MALEAKVPVIPVAMIGTDKVQPIGKKIPHLGRVGIVIGEPLDFSRYEGMADDRLVLRSITDEIMYALMELSRQEYVDVYAATMRERLAAARRTKALEAISVAASTAVNAVTGSRAGDTSRARTDPVDSSPASSPNPTPTLTQASVPAIVTQDDPSPTGLTG
jgi:1-acyl-sn-glycerol-3-phosphate acyltransferase